MAHGSSFRSFAFDFLIYEFNVNDVSENAVFPNCIHHNAQHPGLYLPCGVNLSEIINTIVHKPLKTIRSPLRNLKLIKLISCGKNNLSRMYTTFIKPTTEYDSLAGMAAVDTK